jgi:hypothetical protein
MLPGQPPQNPDKELIEVSLDAHLFIDRLCRPGNKVDEGNASQQVAPGEGFELARWRRTQNSQG